jgi:hypothetical protein
MAEVAGEAVVSDKIFKCLGEDWRSCEARRQRKRGKMALGSVLTDVGTRPSDPSPAGVRPLKQSDVWGASLAVAERVRPRVMTIESSIQASRRRAPIRE